jgi:UDP-N-acetyl-D-galactosamine dehydrogenase
VFDIVRELKSYGAIVDVHDPWADPAEAKAEYALELAVEPEKSAYDAVVVAVAHKQFRDMGVEGIRGFGKPGSVVYDAKYLLRADQVDDRL